MRKTPVKARTVAGERVLITTCDDTTIAFGLGPARCDIPYEDRAQSLLAHWAGQLRSLRWCRQVHGTTLASLAAGPDHPLRGAHCVGRCDGLVTAEIGVGLVVWTADCVPLILFGGGLIAAIHAGWRGVAAGISRMAVRRFEIENGARPKALAALMGPAVGACHYEVGHQVLQDLSSPHIPDHAWRQGRAVDLRALVAAQLVAAGMREEGVTAVGGCTACDPDLASYRRDGMGAGRQFSLVFRSARPLS